MEEKEGLVSMEEVKLDIMEESLDSPKMERFDLEKRYHMNQVLCDTMCVLGRMSKLVW